METTRARMLRRGWMLLLIALALTNSGCALVAAGVVGGVAGGATYTMLNNRAAAEPVEPHVVPVKATTAEPPVDY